MSPMTLKCLISQMTNDFHVYDYPDFSHGSDEFDFLMSLATTNGNPNAHDVSFDLIFLMPLILPTLTAPLMTPSWPWRPW